MEGIYLLGDWTDNDAVHTRSAAKRTAPDITYIKWLHDAGNA